jgi:hypothetical protein
MNTQQDLAAAAFPMLDDAQMPTLARCAGASVKTYATGQTLIRVDERDFKFFVVEILDESREAPRVLAVLGRGELTGDVAHLTGGAALATAVASRESSVRGIGGGGTRDPEPVSGTGRRHLAGVHRAPAPAAGVGSVHGRAGGRLALLSRHPAHPRLLSKNRVPYTRIDLEADPQVGGGQRRHRFAAAVRGSSRRGVGRRSATVSAGPHAR